MNPDSSPGDLDATLGRVLDEIEAAGSPPDVVSGGLDPAIRSREAVDRLSELTTELLRKDLDRAEKAAALARAIADELDDDYCRGRSLRSAAVVRVLRRDHRGAVALFESSLERLERAGAPLQAAIALTSAIEPLIHLGEYDRALDWAERARRILRELGDRHRLARLDLNIGAIHSRRDHHREALRWYRQAHVALLEVGTPQDVGTALRNIAVCLQDLHRLPAAQEAYEKARDFCRENQLPAFVLELDCNIAYLFHLRAEYGRAIAHFEHSRQRCVEQHDRHHAALCDLDQSEIFLELNLLAEAEQLARRAGDGFARLGMAYEVAKALTFRAICRCRQGRVARALELLAEARESFEHEGNRVWCAIIDHYQALVLLSDGRTGEAIPLARGARDAFVAFELPARRVAAELLLARLALAEGDLDRAEASCAAVRQHLEELQMPALGFQEALLSAQVLERRGLVEEALAGYSRAAELLEALRRHLQTEELRISFAGDKAAVFESLVWLRLRGRPTAADRREAFRCMEMAKSRSLVDLLAVRAHALPEKTADESGDVAELRRLREELNSHYHRIDREDQSRLEPGQRRVTSLRRRAAELERELQEVLRRIQASDREFRSLQGATTIDPETVARALPDGAALVQYFVCRDRICCCVLGRDTLEIEPLGEVGAVREANRVLRFQLEKYLRGDYPEDLRRFAESAVRGQLRALYEGLIEPVRAHLESARHLVLAPHDFMHFLPFQAFHDGEGYLADRWLMSYAPSASVFYLSSTRDIAEGSGALVLAAPDERAPRMAEEARAVAATLPDAELLIGEAATIESLRRRGAEARWIHLAAHGHFRADNPMFSALQLGDGRLGLFDLYELELRAEMVVLSGCGTGLSSLRGADDLVGLTRGLLYAGARALMVSLWDVSDESTTRFMRLFYASLVAGSPAAEALAQAMRTLRASRPEPYFWAPFVLVGGSALAGGRRAG